MEIYLQLKNYNMKQVQLKLKKKIMNNTKIQKIFYFLLENQGHQKLERLVIQKREK